MAYPASVDFENGWTGFTLSGEGSYFGARYDRHLAHPGGAADGHGFGTVETQGLGTTGSQFVAPGDVNDATVEADLWVDTFTPAAQVPNAFDAAANPILWVAGATAPSSYFQLVLWESNGVEQPAGQQFLSWRANPSAVAGTWEGSTLPGIRLDAGRKGKWLRLKWRVHVSATGADDGAILDVYERGAAPTQIAAETLNFNRDTLREFHVGLVTPNVADVVRLRWDAFRVGTSALSTRVIKGYSVGTTLTKA